MIDEVFYLFTFSFLILIFILVVYLGFDIKENILPVPASLATVTLQTDMLAGGLWSIRHRIENVTHMLNILILFILLFFLFLVVF